VKNLNRLHDQIIGLIKKYDDLTSKEQDSKLKYIIAQKLRLYRAKNRLTQDQLASKLVVNRIQIIRWEQGYCKPQRWVIRLLEEQGILDLEKK